MKKSEPQRENIIEFIIANLKKSEASGKILEVTSSKFKIKETKFYRLLKIAKERHRTQREAINKVLNDEEIASARKEREKALADDLEIKEWLSKQFRAQTTITKDAFGNLITVVQDAEGEIISKDVDDVFKLKVIAELNKMRGHYAPAKTQNDVTIKQEQPLFLPLKK